MKIGILNRVELYHFKRIVKIPINISYNKICKISNDTDTVKLYFLKLIMRKEKLQNIKKLFT
jgi:hypothetical protein